MIGDIVLFPEIDKLVIPKDKLTEYVFNPAKSVGKNIMFDKYLGYNEDNQEMLCDEIVLGLNIYAAVGGADRG